MSAIPWRLIAAFGIAIGLLLGAIYVAGQLKQVGALRVENGQLRSDLAASKKVASEVAKGGKRKEVIRHKADQRKKEIINAPPEDDAPLAPILRRELDSLPASDQPIDPQHSS